MKRVFFQAAFEMLLIFGIAALPCFADSLSQTGPITSNSGLGEGNGQQASAIIFTTSTGETGLSMDAVLTAFGSSQTISWWITNMVGSGTTGANVFDSGTFAGPSTMDTTTQVFSGVNLGPGTYYVVLCAVGQGNETGWDFTNSPTVSSSGGLSYDGYEAAADGSGSFAPSYDYSNGFQGLNFLFSMQTTSSTPEPASLLLLATGLLGIVPRLRRRK